MNKRFFIAISVSLSLQGGDFTVDPASKEFKSYATLAAIKAVDTYVSTLRAIRPAMQKLGNCSPQKNFFTGLEEKQAKLKAISQDTSSENAVFRIRNGMQEYCEYEQFGESIQIFFGKYAPKILVQVYYKNYVDSAIGGWSAIKPLVGKAIDMLEAHKAFDAKLREYSRKEGMPNDLFKDLVSDGSALFNAEQIDMITTEHTQASQALTTCYKKAAHDVLMWAESAEPDAIAALQEAVTSIPQWASVSITRNSNRRLLVRCQACGAYHCGDVIKELS